MRPRYALYRKRTNGAPRVTPFYTKWGAERAQARHVFGADEVSAVVIELNPHSSLYLDSFEAQRASQTVSAEFVRLVDERLRELAEEMQRTAAADHNHSPKDPR